MKLESESAVLRPTAAQTRQKTSLDGSVRVWATVQPERTALVAGSGKVSYAQLVDAIDRLARGMRSIGVRRGDRVVVCLPNSVGFVTSFFALLNIGALPVLVPPSRRTTDIELLQRISDEAKPVTWIVPQAGAYWHRGARDALAAARGLSLCLLTDGPAAGGGVQTMSLDEVAAAGEGDLPVEAACPDAEQAADADEIAMFLVSAGKSGAPRLVPLSADTILAVFNTMAALSGLNAESVYLAVLPAAHHFALMCPGILGTLAYGGAVLLATDFGLEGTPVAELRRATHVALTPALGRQWIERGTPARHGLTNLSVVQLGGARPTSELAEQLARRLKGRLQQVFSMAEGLVFCTRLADSPEIAFHTQGRPAFASGDFRIVGGRDDLLPAGAYGELCVRGPAAGRLYGEVPAGDLGEHLHDGYIRTGDWAAMRDDGNLVLAGCVADYATPCGGRASMSEIEAWLTVLSGVSDVVALRVPDGTRKERICAFLRAQEGTDVAMVRAALRRNRRSELSLPDQLELIHQWPLDPSGNIDRARLVELALRRRGPSL